MADRPPHNSAQQSAADAAKPRAWQPLTPNGVAAFALAGYGRLLVLLLAMATGMGLGMAWFFHSAWFPSLEKAVLQLPARAEIKHGLLHWPNPSPVSLAANPFLSFSVDLDHTGNAATAADLQIELGRTNLHLTGFLGTLSLPYPPALNLPLSHQQAVPWWGAWKQALVGGLLVGSTLALLTIWIILAAAYIPLARVTAWLHGFPLSLGAAWRLCAAALMPGALLMTGGIVGYAWGLLDIVRLAFIAVFHLVVAWVYIPLSVLCLPRSRSAGGGNPFLTQPTKDHSAVGEGKSGNPFIRRS